MNRGGRVLLKATRPYPTRVLRRSSLRFDLHDADRSAEDDRTTSSGIISTLDERNGDASLTAIKEVGGEWMLSTERSVCATTPGSEEYAYCVFVGLCLPNPDEGGGGSGGGGGSSSPSQRQGGVWSNNETLGLPRGLNIRPLSLASLFGLSPGTTCGDFVQCGSLGPSWPGDTGFLQSTAGAASAAKQGIIESIEAWFQKLAKSLEPSGPAAMPNLCMAGDTRTRSIGSTTNPYPTKDPTASNEDFKRSALHQCEASGASYTVCTASPLGAGSAEVYCDCCKYAKP
jgi:hypothetical protein